VLAFVLVLAVVTTQSAQAQTFTVLYSFMGSPDGAYPYGGLVRDKKGNLYGTTWGGGSSGYGTVFTVDTSGTEAVLHSFTGGTDGGHPVAGLIRDKKENLYGTTEEGGSSGYGTVFTVDTSGTEAVLYSFAGGTKDGCYPYGGLTRDKAGTLYGTTFNCGASGYGTVFTVDTSGTEIVLHSFSGGTKDGAYPDFTGLLMDEKGNLYGVTEEGGASNYGTVYKLNKSGKTLTVLYSFTGGTDGGRPVGGLLRDKKGNLYGITNEGGSSGVGTVFKLNKSGTETVLHSFAEDETDGCYPFGTVKNDAKRNLYGTTSLCGASAEGAVYKLSKSGTETVLHSFVGSDGAYPYGGLLRDAKGKLYGTTTSGGASFSGTVFKLTP